MAPSTIEDIYTAALRRPIVREMTAIEAKLAAGPAISSTSAVPGESPFNMSDRAMGIDPVAQTYIGTATATIKILQSQTSNNNNYEQRV